MEEINKLVGRQVRVVLFDGNNLWPMIVQPKNENESWPVKSMYNTVYISENNVGSIDGNIIYMKSQVSVH